jgi:hypothetical protein
MNPARKPCALRRWPPGAAAKVSLAGRPKNGSPLIVFDPARFLGRRLPVFRTQAGSGDDSKGCAGQSDAGAVVSRMAFAVGQSGNMHGRCECAAITARTDCCRDPLTICRERIINGGMAAHVDSIASYVEGRVKAGLSKTEVKEELLAVGWSEEEADAAYRDGLVALGIPLPRESDRPKLARKSSTVDVVVNFFSFIVLGIVATALGTLYFQIINMRFPDPLAEIAVDGAWSSTRAIHHAIASLIIAFPLYYAAMRIWFRKFREDEGRAESRLSRWLTYIVLLAAAVTIVGDLIAVLFKLLQGEISARFLLKALTILVIAGIIFGFYFLERKKIQYGKGGPSRPLSCSAFFSGSSRLALPIQPEKGPSIVRAPHIWASLRDALSCMHRILANCRPRSTS